MLIKEKEILITGAVGFIGCSLAMKLLSKGYRVLGVDNLNEYYDTNLKEYRLNKLNELSGFRFEKIDISNKEEVIDLFNTNKFSCVVNLAAQAGVRYSITNPDTYIKSNIIGFFNMIETSAKSNIDHFIYASSSSVYGNNTKTPYSTDDRTDNPVSLYAATKKADELIAHAYSKIHNLRTTGLRFFTVYGPMGRPDMAYYSFVNKMIKGESIQLYNNGDMLRDFTYIDDVTSGIISIIENPPKYSDGVAPYKVYNIGNNKPTTLRDFINVLEDLLLKEGLISRAINKELLPMQKGDVYQTYADIREIKNDYGFSPKTNLREGLSEFVRWYKEYHKEL